MQQDWVDWNDPKCIRQLLFIQNFWKIAVFEFFKATPSQTWLNLSVWSDHAQIQSHHFQRSPWIWTRYVDSFDNRQLSCWYTENVHYTIHKGWHTCTNLSQNGFFVLHESQNAQKTSFEMISIFEPITLLSLVPRGAEN